jgi:hypothetical protein
MSLVMRANGGTAVHEVLAYGIQLVVPTCHCVDSAPEGPPTLGVHRPLDLMPRPAQPSSLTRGEKFRQCVVIGLRHAQDCDQKTAVPDDHRWNLVDNEALGLDLWTAGALKRLAVETGF